MSATGAMGTAGAKAPGQVHTWCLKEQQGHRWAGPQTWPSATCFGRLGPGPAGGNLSFTFPNKRIFKTQTNKTETPQQGLTRGSEPGDPHACLPPRPSQGPHQAAAAPAAHGPALSNVRLSPKDLPVWPAGRQCPLSPGFSQQRGCGPKITQLGLPPPFPRQPAAC